MCQGCGRPSFRIRRRFLLFGRRVPLRSSKAILPIDNNTSLARPGSERTNKQREQDKKLERTSLTNAPRSFMREKKPGIPRNLRDFMNEVAFMMYTFPVDHTRCKYKSRFSTQQAEENSRAEQMEQELVLLSLRLGVGTCSRAWLSCFLREVK